MAQRLTKRRIILLIAVVGMIVIGLPYLAYKFVFPRRILKEISPPHVVEVKLSPEQYEEIHRRFHRNLFVQTIENKEDYACLICHTIFPHKKHKRYRAMMNMHSDFLICQTCHVISDDTMQLVYKWVNSTGIEPHGRPFGLDYDKTTGWIEDTDDHYSKITPFVKENGKLRIVGTDYTAEQVRQYLATQPQPYAEEEAPSEFHLGMTTTGHECEVCHAENSIFDFAALGFSPTRTKDLVTLGIKGMVTKYEEFYLPDLLRKVEE